MCEKKTKSRQIKKNNKKKDVSKNKYDFFFSKMD